MNYLGPVHTIPDSFRIGSLFISDRPSVHTMTLESDTLRIVFAESNHSAVNVECVQSVLMTEVKLRENPLDYW